MSLIKQIYLLFDDFNDAQCYAHNGYDPEWRPTWNEDIEEQLRQIQRGSPISLPDDYCEVFRAFGGGCIEDSRENRIMPAMTFWTWDDIMEFDATVDFFKDCPNALPIGDDMVNKRHLFATVKANDKIRIYKDSFEAWYKSQNRHTIVTG